MPWLHTACNELSTHLFVHEQHGEQALRSASSMVLAFRGRAIHDHLRAYATFTQAQHGAYNAHIRRELQGVIAGGSAWGKAMHTFLLEMSHQALPLQGEAAEHTRQRYRQMLSRAALAEPPPAAQKGRGRPKSTPGRHLLRRRREHEDAVLAVALVAGVPFTNNQAERDLRPAKVNQNVSGCFRTGQGAKVYARLQAVISTCRKQERNVFATLRALFAHQPVSLIAGT